MTTDPGTRPAPQPPRNPRVRTGAAAAGDFSILEATEQQQRRHDAAIDEALNDPAADIAIDAVEAIRAASERIDLADVAKPGRNYRIEAKPVTADDLAGNVRQFIATDGDHTTEITATVAPSVPPLAAAGLMPEHEPAPTPYLEQALDIIHGARNEEYGHPTEDFQRIADYWNIYLGDRITTPITTTDVAAIMVLLKMGRLSHNPHHADSWIDICGYVGCYDRIQRREAGLE